MAEGEISIHITSGLGILQREPFIQMVVDDHQHPPQIVQFTPEAARQHAQHILEATESAIADAFIFYFLKEKLKTVDDYQGAMVLRDFREWRNERRL